MTPAILVLNAGSSSVKFRLFEQDDKLPLLAQGRVTGIGTKPLLTAQENPGKQKEERFLSTQSTHEDAMEVILNWIENHENEWKITSAGHRIVHGGTLFHGPVKLDEHILTQLHALAPLAPLHQPHNLAAIEILERIKPGLVQIGCFDTAFHAQHDPLFSVYAVPKEIENKGIRRYGFHGLSYEWIARTLARNHPDIARGKVIVAHLGNGASLCALENGASVDTTMGMTALEGLPMGTRSGSIDPGAVLFMIRSLGMTPDDVERFLYNECGLKGLSGQSNDVKILLENGGEDARFALEYFAHKTAQFMASMAISLGGVETIVFTGGIGENAEPVRTAIVNKLSCLASPKILTIPADEERMIGYHVLDLLEPKFPPL